MTMSMLLNFSDRRLENEFWSQAKGGPLRLIEIVGLLVSIFITIAMDTLSRSPDSEVSWQSLLNRFVQIFGLVGALSLACVMRPVYERWHDWIMVTLRLSSYPMLLFLKDSTCGPLATSNRFLLVASAFVLFGPLKAFVDAMRFPLRFRHHVVVQLVVIGVMSTCNYRVCSQCFVSDLSRESIFQACQWTTLGTTGIWLDCESAGFEMACVTFSLQLHVLLGLLAPSFAIYKKELGLRLKVLNENPAQQIPPSASEPAEQQGHLKTQ
ncbi:hypothetical protein BSKO_09444 [Bryopsis sp. KO-2023]|nr:hypothetical protein BSKO_09444 [Bryopsis sp. KO-2023]